MKRNSMSLLLAATVALTTLTGCDNSGTPSGNDLGSLTIKGNTSFVSTCSQTENLVDPQHTIIAVPTVDGIDGGVSNVFVATFSDILAGTWFCTNTPIDTALKAVKIQTIVKYDSTTVETVDFTTGSVITVPVTVTVTVTATSTGTGGNVGTGGNTSTGTGGNPGIDGGAGNTGTTTTTTTVTGTGTGTFTGTGTGTGTFTGTGTLTGTTTTTTTNTNVGLDGGTTDTLPPPPVDGGTTSMTLTGTIEITCEEAVTQTKLMGCLIKEVDLPAPNSSCTTDQNGKCTLIGLPINASLRLMVTANGYDFQERKLTLLNTVVKKMGFEMNKTDLPSSLDWISGAARATLGQTLTNVLSFLPAKLVRADGTIVMLNSPDGKLKCVITSGANFVSFSSNCHDKLEGLVAGCAVVTMTHPDASNSVVRSIRVKGADDLPATCPVP